MSSVLLVKTISHWFTVFIFEILFLHALKHLNTKTTKMPYFHADAISGEHSSDENMISSPNEKRGDDPLERGGLMQEPNVQFLLQISLIS